MPKFDYDIGVIGGGAAGLTVSAGSAQLGAKTLLIEKEPKLGGDCLHYGCVPSKTLIRTAQVYHQAKRFQEFGLPAIEIPPVDYAKVAARIQSVIDEIQPHDSEERFCSLGVQVKFGQCSFIDEHSVRMNGETVSAKTWVVATGSSPGVPPIPGLDKTPFLTNMDIFSMQELPSSLIILGAGAIAMEMAQAFTRLGARVEVVQRSGQILSREDKDMADIVMDRLLNEGVLFHLNTHVQEVSDQNGVRNVRIQYQDGRETVLSSAAILVAMGRRVNVEGLGLNNAGIKYDDKGVRVTSRLRTSQKHIYAAGDVLGKYQFTHAAGYEGGIVVSNAVFHLPRKVNYATMPWCTYTDPELASIGLNEKAAQEKGLEYEVHIEEFSGNDRALAEGETAGQIKLLLNDSGKPLGVQIAGAHAGEVISEWVAALNSSAKMTTMAGAVHPYPTLAEINKRVAGAYLGPKIFSEKVKKTLKFFFNFKGRACTLPEDAEK